MASISTNKKTGQRRIFFTGADGERRKLHLGKMTSKNAQVVNGHIEAILAAQLAKTSLERRTADWLGELDAVMHNRLAAVGLVPKRIEKEAVELAQFIDGYIKGRSDVKPSTATVLGHTRRCLVEYFGPTKRLEDVTAGDTDLWRIWLEKHEKLAENTIRRRCGIARQYFRAAMRRKLIAENPFADMQATTVRGNRERDFFVTAKMADAVLAACPDAQWRLLFSLSRFGGLRCPSEHLGLRWRDIDWERNRMTVRSPKTERHEGGDSREIPIFPEIREHLEAVFDAAPEGTEFVITRSRRTSANLRTQLNRIIRRAGLKPWPKLFQNLRATRQTELAEQFPLKVVCQWIGNSQAVALGHYLQITEDHFDKATKKVAHNVARHTAERGELGKTVETPYAKNPEETVVSRGIVLVGMGDEGLEPPTSTV